MKVLLIKPPSISDHIQPPLGLAYLASSIADQHEVEILDMLKNPMSDKEFCEYISDGQYTLVGFQCYTQELPAVAKLARLVKQVSSQIITIAGGPHPTLLPSETMGYIGREMDFLLRGEGDENFPRFVNGMVGGKRVPQKIPGLVWRKGQKVIINELGSPVIDLDKEPFPAWDLIQPQTYPPAQHGAFYKQFPIAPIITTRGCPFACKFCSAPILSGQNVRRRNPEKILEEIKYLYSKFGIREFHIIDDNFTINKNHARAVLEKIIHAKLDISIAFPNGIRIETVDPDLLNLMKKSGVYLISLGLESGTNRILRLMNKKLTVEQIEEKVNMIKRAGMKMAAFFVMGYPGETKEDLRATIRFSLRLPLIRANYFDFLPLPGTPIYHELEERGELEKVDWTKFHFMSAPYAPVGLSRKILRNFQREAFLRFYLRPRILLAHLFQIKSFRHFKYLLRRFYHWLLM